MLTRALNALHHSAVPQCTCYIWLSVLLQHANLYSVAAQRCGLAAARQQGRVAVGRGMRMAWTRS